MSPPPDEFDELSRLLARDGLSEESDRIHRLRHRTAWTTASEMLGELGVELKAIRAARWKDMDAETRSAWRACAGQVRRAWPAFCLFRILP